MATILESLRGINAYPIPLAAITQAAGYGGLDIEREATPDVLRSSGYKRSKAELLLWLSLAPDVSQGGQSYSFTDEQRLQFRHQASALLEECGENGKLKPIYGYKGSRL